MATPQQQLQALQQQVALLQTMIEQQQSTIQALQQRTTLQRPKPCLPDPEKFNGKPLHFDTWLPSIEAKLEVDGEAIGSAIAQFYYVYLNLEPTVQSTVLPQLAAAKASKSWDPSSILTQLQRIYHDPHKAKRAEDRLFELSQGSTESLASYIARFERAIFEANAVNWPDANKIPVFRKGLRQVIKDRLDTQLLLPSDYPAFLKVVQQLSGRSSASASASVPASTPAPRFQPVTQQRPSDPMDLSNLELNTLSFQTGQRPASPPRARSTSPAQRQVLRLEGKCVRCGSLRHWVSDCPLEPHRPSSPERQFLRRDTSVRRQVFRPVPESRYPPGPTIQQLDTRNCDGYTSEQERRWMEEWENGWSEEDDSVGSDLVRLQKGQL
jgi:Retrotransposon gag protein